MFISNFTKRFSKSKFKMAGKWFAKPLSLLAIFLTNPGKINPFVS